MNFFKDFLKGVCIGSGAILPGISSGILCVIFGIYDKLVESVLDIFKDFKKNFFYLLPIGIGSFFGIIIFGKILSILFSSFPTQSKYAFIGLILGSIPILITKLNSQKRFRLRYVAYTLIAFIIGVLTVLLEENISSSRFLLNSNLINSSWLNNNLNITQILFLIIVGMCMSIGVVVPGISSTLILMCFGVYDIYLSSISTMNLSILIPLGIGLIIGGTIFLKLIKFLLLKYYMQTFYSIIGFTLGSILILYTPLTFDFSGFISVILLILCFYIAEVFEKMS